MGINDAFFRHLLEERLRLESNGLPTYQEGLGMNFIIRCNGNATKVLDDPFLSGTLRWLFIGCGAIEVVEEGDF